MDDGKDVVIRPPAATAVASAPTPRVLMSVPLWIYWWRIAEERANAAEKDGEAGDGMEASMVAILASASALEGMRGSLGQHTDCPLPKLARATRQEAKIMETFKRCFVVGWQMQGWKESLDWLRVARSSRSLGGEAQGGCHLPGQPRLDDAGGEQRLFTHQR